MFRVPEPPIPVRVFGTTPGVLDPTQPSRLLRVPGATLSFASFDPLCADPNNSRKKSRHDEISRSKRIVIEHAPGPHGGNTCRFVPRARLEQGADDEGMWPRVVDLCGESAYLSQDQWDIHKLDPAYDCYVRAPPNLTVISRRMEKDQELFEIPPDVSQEAGPSTLPHGKRRHPSPDSATRLSGDAHKKFRNTTIITDSEEETGEPDILLDDSEEDEVEEIIDDEITALPPRPRRPSQSRRSPSKGPARSYHHKLADSRSERREKLARKLETYFRPASEDEIMIDLTQGSTESSQTPTPPAPAPAPAPAPPPQARSVPTTPNAPNASKRRASPTLSPFYGQGNSASNPIEITAEQPSSKRARTVSPTSQRRPQQKRGARAQSRVDKYQNRKNVWNEWYHQNVMHGLYSDFPEATGSHPQSQSETIQEEEEPAPEEPPQGQQHGEPDADARQAFIEEARHKLAELEKDRPIWEEAARRRREQEAREEVARQARREEEAQRASREDAEVQKRQRQWAQAEAQRRAHEEQARAQNQRRTQEERERAEREQARRRQRQQEMRWSQGVWTQQRALERYKTLSEVFDTAKFTPAEPLTFDMIPWPVLMSPRELKVEDIDWAAVEDFFKAVRPYMRSQDYKVFVEKSHKRFHPDRWRARSLLKSVEDDEMRGYMEVAANTVAQAVTPIWREVKGN